MSTRSSSSPLGLPIARTQSLSQIYRQGCSTPRRPLPRRGLSGDGGQGGRVYNVIATLPPLHLYGTTRCPFQNTKHNASSDGPPAPTPYTCMPRNTAFPPARTHLLFIGEAFPSEFDLVLQLGRSITSTKHSLAQYSPLYTAAPWYQHLCRMQRDRSNAPIADPTQPTPPPPSRSTPQN